MRAKVQKIKFNGLGFILTTPDRLSGPIATIETYKKGECSYAHLHSDGRIMRFRNQIGIRNDIEFGEIIEIEIDPAEAFAGLLGESWDS